MIGFELINSKPGNKPYGERETSVFRSEKFIMCVVYKFS